jgi:hypothetical protein
LPLFSFHILPDGVLARATINTVENPDRKDDR